MSFIRGIILLLIWGTLTGASAAQEHHFSLNAIGGVLNGQAEEIVYRTSVSTDKLSQLLWDMKPLVYGGVKLGYQFIPQVRKFGYFADFALKSGIQGKTGVMEDRDWLSEDYANWLTHYSVHDNTTKTALLIDANFGAHYRLNNSFLLKASLSFSYMNFLWSATGGSFLYPSSWGDHRYLLESTDEVIRYQQTWVIIAPGIGFWAAFNDYFDIELAFKISGSVYFEDKDEHFMRDLVVTSVILNGLFIEPSLLFSFKPRNFFSLSLSVTYRNISRVRGDAVYTEYESTVTRYSNVAGAAYAAFDAGLAVTYRFSTRQK